jgi:esterase FrsA
MFEGHGEHMAHFGVSAEDISEMRDNINDMWADVPGGWVYEW